MDKRIERRGKRAGFLKGFLSAAVFVLIIFLFLPVRYESNDDFGLVKRLRAQSETPSEPYHPALSCGMALVLSSLYRHAPGFPWYGFIVCFATFGGMTLMLSVLYRSTRGWSMLLSFPLLGMLFLHVFSFVTFTAASLILEFGVFLCVWEWVIRGECPAKNPRIYAWLLALGFLLGFFLRWHLVLTFLPLAVPILFFLRRDQWKKAVMIVAVLSVVIVGERVLSQAITSEEYKAFAKYNLLRARFHDSVRGDHHGNVTRVACAKAGWSEEDYAFFRSWIVYDNRLFNSQTLRTFLRENDPKKEHSIPFLVRERFIENFYKGGHYIVALALSIAAIGVYRLGGFWGLSKGVKWRIVLSLAVITTGILGVMYVRFVPRVFVPLFAYLFGACFFLLHLEEEPSAQQRNRPVRKTMIVVGAILLSLLASLEAYARAKRNFDRLQESKIKKEHIRECLDWVKKENPDPEPLLILMDPGKALGTQYIHPLKESSDFTDLRVLPGGWSVNSPHYDAILKNMGLKDGRELMRWMIDNQEALLVLMADGPMDAWHWRHLWKSYFSRRIAPNRGIQLLRAYDFRNAQGAGLLFYRIKSRS